MHSFWPLPAGPKASVSPQGRKCVTGNYQLTPLRSLNESSMLPACTILRRIASRKANSLARIGALVKKAVS
jgi:hypothetical protein